MESWEDRSCIGRRFGTGCPDGVRASGGTPLGVGSDLFESGEVGCSSETLRLWVHQAEADQSLRPASAYFAQAEVADRRPRK